MSNNDMQPPPMPPMLNNMPGPPMGHPSSGMMGPGPGIPPMNMMGELYYSLGLMLVCLRTYAGLICFSR